MIIDDAETERLNIPRERIELPEGLRLAEDADFQIQYGENNDPQAPFLAIRLLCQRESCPPPLDSCITFQEEPPADFLAGVAVSASSLADTLSGDAKDQGRTVGDFLDAAANRVLTPKSKLAIEKHGHWLVLWLVIGDWEGRYQAPLAELKHLFDL